MRHLIIALVTVMAASAGAEPRHDHDHTRTIGVVGHHGRARIVYERRAPAVIVHDPYIHTYARDYQPRHRWNQYHPYGHRGWLGVFGVRSWDRVSTVTCEAANRATGELYPVTASHDGSFTDPIVNSVLAQALDECAAEAGAHACVPVEPACSYQ
jgi:hypothetical protein